MPCVIVQADPWVLPTKGDSAAQCFSVTFNEWCKKKMSAPVFVLGRRLPGPLKPEKLASQHSWTCGGAVWRPQDLTCLCRLTSEMTPLSANS